MKKLCITFLLFLIILPQTTFSVEAQLPPIFSTASVHDPSVIKTDEEYYVFGSHLALAKSPDLKNWYQVEGDGVTPANSLFEDVTKELEEALDWAQTDTLWAPDVIQLADGRYYMYYNACEGSSPRSALGIAVSDSVEGPYEDLGIILRSGMTPEESQIIDGTPYDETHYPEIYDATIHPNVIDPDVFYDKEGKLWMVYGSYSGGIFILELDPSNGKPYSGQGYGTKLVGGNHSRIEAPYIVYHQATDAYYLYLSYGGLDAVGGYNVRVAKSLNPDGPYYDIQGNNMIDVKGGDGTFFDDESIAPTGSKIIGNHLFKSHIGEPGEDVGYVSPGHNSVYVDEVTGEQFLIFHSRFPNRGELHQVRVHQLFMNEDGWPVVAPFQYHNEKLLSEANNDMVAGSYKMIIYSSEISEHLDESVNVNLESDGTVTGELSGFWEINEENIAISIDNVTYKGFILQQWNPIAEQDTLTFTTIASNGLSLWGVQSLNDGISDHELVQTIARDLDIGNTHQVVHDFILPTEKDGASIQWESSNTRVVTHNGEINRPIIGSDPAHAVLTATVIKGQATATRSFDIYVMPRSVKGLVAKYDFEDNLVNQVNGEQAIITGDRIDNEGGNITFSNGKFGKAAKFDGNSGIRLADGLIQSNNYSVSLWLKPEQLTPFTTGFFGSESPSSWISIVPAGFPDSGGWMFWSGEQWFDGFSNRPLLTDEWNHLAFTVDNGTLTLFMNGEWVEEYQGIPNVFQSAEAAFALGVNYWDVPYKGLMDEVLVFDNYTLTEADVTDLFQTSTFSIDRTDINELLDRARKYVDDSQYTEETRSKLKQVIERLLEVDTYTTFDHLEEDTAQLNYAMAQLEQIAHANDDDSNTDEIDKRPDGGKKTNNNTKQVEDNNDIKQLDIDAQTESDTANTLPNTASNMYHLLALGIVILLGGFALFFISRSRI